MCFSCGVCRVSSFEFGDESVFLSAIWFRVAARRARFRVAAVEARMLVRGKSRRQSVRISEAAAMMHKSVRLWCGFERHGLIWLRVFVGAAWNSNVAVAGFSGR